MGNIRERMERNMVLISIYLFVTHYFSFITSIAQHPPFFSSSLNVAAFPMFVLLFSMQGQFAEVSHLRFCDLSFVRPRNPVA